MKYSEFDTIQRLKEQISNMKLFLSFGNNFNILGLTIEELTTIKEKVKKLELDLKEMVEIPQKFNQYFSNRGWISYDSMNHKTMKIAINTYNQKGIDEAEKIMFEYYKPNNLTHDFLRLKALPSFSKRYKFIEYAIEDYKQEKYYSVIPLLIMIIDGTVNEIVGKGFHTETSNVDVWNSITNIDNGIKKIREIFCKGRNKTREEMITLPYRNGILHGMDLGYDNYIVAAKCWHFLFVIRDWGLSKISEESRIQNFKKETKVPSLKESINDLNELQRLKDATKNWQKRHLSQQYIESLKHIKSTNDNLPEVTAIKFLDYWMKSNYGYMSKLYWSLFFDNEIPNVKIVRDRFANLSLSNYEVTKISDEAAAITNIEISCDLGNKKKNYVMRMIYEGSDSKPRARDLLDGVWKIVSVQEKTENE